MRKFIFLILFNLWLIIGLVGCTDTETEGQQEGQIKMDAQNIVSIRLMGDDQSLTTISGISSFERFVQAITTAEYDRGQLDIAPKDYRITVVMKDGTSYDFSFWIHDTGLFTRSGQTGHYRLSDVGKNDLLVLFQPASNEGISPSPSISKPQPPSVQVTVGGEQFDAIQGSYCWNDEGTGQCVDMASYDQLVTKQNIHPQAASGDPVELVFSSAPEELTIMASFPADERPDEVLSVHNGRFLLAAGSGKHLYIINAKWPQGSASYVFEVECTVKKN